MPVARGHSVALAERIPCLPYMADGADIDGDSEAELNSAPQGIDVDGDGDNDGTGHFEFTIDLIVPATE